MADKTKSDSVYDDKVTITIDRRIAEDLYYDLLLALGGSVYSGERYGKSGKSGGKSYAASYDWQR